MISEEQLIELKKKLIDTYKKRGFKNCIGSVERTVEELFEGLKMKIILFNKNSASPWQAYENTQVMVTNRKGKSDIFCAAKDVQLGDNVWEHNIVQDITVLDNKVDKVKFHYGPVHKT